MKLDLKKELILLLITLAPLIYLFIVWDQLPQEVATHYNYKGEADNFSSKKALIPILGMGFFTYFILLVVPFIDPKKQIENMGNKFFHIKLVSLVMLSAVMSFIVYKTLNPETPIQFLIVILGTFFMALGNYFQTIKPNYFLGIRTPWTLQSEEVWTKTHKITGKIWIIGGLSICIAYFIFPMNIASIIMIIMVIILVIQPILHSYLIYNKETSIN